MNLTALADRQEFGLGLPPAECLLGFQNARCPLLALRDQFWMSSAAKSKKSSYSSAPLGNRAGPRKNKSLQQALVP